MHGESLLVSQHVYIWWSLNLTERDFSFASCIATLVVVLGFQRLIHFDILLLLVQIVGPFNFIRFVNFVTHLDYLMSIYV